MARDHSQSENTRMGEFTANLSRAQRSVTYHTPTPAQVEDITTLRGVAASLIATIMTLCPPSADRTMAIRKVREALMTANASIVLKGKDPTRTEG